ncbi:MAG: transcription antitermination factor NusB [Candidatus Kapabacteria bacterium]|nr:transcription antitermination factor NusB [Ignavibacteriota bacterium]MCW5884777.1 transcription antitermination factor NusB [Candidatus Kapabacteria bacterium]
MLSKSDLETIISHSVDREFNFGDEVEEILKDKILKPEEVFELEADIPIKWSSGDLNFLKNLIEKVLISSMDTDERIKGMSNNWELERINLIDRILIHIARAEFQYFEEIPPKVTINEIIDIAKKYSTNKSGYFVNGVLDALFIKLKNEELIIKKGRGLIEK